MDHDPFDKSMNRSLNMGQTAKLSSNLGYFKPSLSLVRCAMLICLFLSRFHVYKLRPGCVCLDTFKYK